MSTLRANTLKPITSGNSLVLQGDSGGSGVSGPSIDSNGDVDFTQNTNAKVKLPSAGGIYESDGSTPIITESGGSVTIQNATFNGTIGASASGFGLITGADQFRLSANFTTQDFVSGSNVERNDTVFEKIGTGMSYDSSTGVFTFPNTGIWWVVCGATIDSNSGAELFGTLSIDVSTTGVSGTFSTRAISYDSLHASSAFGSTFTSCILDVSDFDPLSASAVAVKFRVDTQSTDVRVRGATDKNFTHMTFIRLGDT